MTDKNITKIKISELLEEKKKLNTFEESGYNRLPGVFIETYEIKGIARGVHESTGNRDGQLEVRALVEEHGTFIPISIIPFGSNLKPSYHNYFVSMLKASSETNRPVTLQGYYADNRFQVYTLEFENYRIEYRVNKKGNDEIIHFEHLD